MTRIIADIPFSLDGFVTGPDPGRTTVWAPAGSLTSSSWAVAPPSARRSSGLVDGLTLHLGPVLLGAGTPLFTGGAPRTLVQRTVVATSTATHSSYDVLRS
ncbi:hypothetical protein [Modestobacter excelsi]|uniref:hypothetical protein n=1 Tax=Modestobacter excelsi TaxID=2213161 RepID=UPI001C20DA36|nr:hypothetical protein [Modestobacter excelsi]